MQPDESDESEEWDDFREGSPAADAKAPAGLAPKAAEDWLDLQSALALRPEAVADQLQSGATPREILSRVGSRIRGQSTGSSWEDRQSNRIRRREKLDRLGIRVVPLTDASYPASLTALTDAPLVLLVRGRASELSLPSIAIVGARAATLAARSTARRLARELAGVGFTIVSGLARGIDAEAHRGALDVHGRTVGVLACGLDQIYPPEHRKLADEIIENGAVISEMPLGAPPRRNHFPLRNRIISGLCVAVIVVEARRRSGSLITVRHALDQGREVFVVPGSIEGPFAEGTNQLLRDGARPIRSARDVIEDLGIPMRSELEPADRRAPARTRNDDKTSVQARVLAALEAGPVSRDELLRRVALDASGLASALLELELAGRVLEERDGRIHTIWN